MEGRIGKYTIVEEIGRGAMGIVYKGVDPLIDRTVAIKTIRFDMYSQPEQRIEAQKRFLREAKSAGNISHPNIVTIYDMGEDSGVFYIAMEYVDGPSLESLLASRKKWTIQETIHLVIEIADGLDLTHRKGIVHRDIKPGNILVDKDGHPHIVDFGIARIPTSNLTQTSAVMGTPYYMAPEQVAARKIDHRVDIFALGAIFYEMLTLEKPFAGENLTTVIYKIMNENPHPMREFQADVPQALEPIVQKVLAKDPDARYQTCRAFIDDLMRYADSAGIPIGDRFHGRSALNETQPLPDGSAAKAARKAKAAAAHGAPRKPLIPILVGMAAVVVIAVVSVFLISKGPREPRANPHEGVENIPAKTDVVTKPPVELNVAKKDDTVKPKTETVAKPPVDTKQDSINTKPAELPKTTVSDLERGEAALRKNDFHTAADLARAVLRANPAEERAKTLLRNSILLPASDEIKAIIREYAANLKSGRVLDFYRTRCTPALFERLRKNVEMIARLYEGIDGTVANETFDASDAHIPNFVIRARFGHTITGRPKGKKNRETLFDGTYIWTLERTDQRWVLVDLVFEAR